MYPMNKIGLFIVCSALLLVLVGSVYAVGISTGASVGIDIDISNSSNGSGSGHVESSNSGSSSNGGTSNSGSGSATVRERENNNRRETVSKNHTENENDDDEHENEKEHRNITIRELSNHTKEIIAGKINAKTGLNLTADDINGSLGATLSAYLSNGRHAHIKYMPDRASLIALDRLRARCDNCTVELKEIGSGNKTRVVYVVETQKESRVLLIFGKKKIVSAEVDAETGEVISIHRPWWSFLSRDKDEVETEIEDNASLTVSE